MLDLLFLGGGVALFCLLIAYARLTNGCEVTMILDYVLGGGLAAILLVYLVVALARPEKF